MAHIDSKLVLGNPIEPSDYDMIAQFVSLPINDTPANWDKGGWRIMTGNANTNFWARVAYRADIEKEQSA